MSFLGSFFFRATLMCVMAIKGIRRTKVSFFIGWACTINPFVFFHHSNRLYHIYFFPSVSYPSKLSIIQCVLRYIASSHALGYYDVSSSSSSTLPSIARVCIVFFGFKVAQKRCMRGKVRRTEEENARNSHHAPFRSIHPILLSIIFSQNCAHSLCMDDDNVERRGWADWVGFLFIFVFSFKVESFLRMLRIEGDESLQFSIFSFSSLSFFSVLFVILYIFRACFLHPSRNETGLSIHLCVLSTRWRRCREFSLIFHAENELNWIKCIFTIAMMPMLDGKFLVNFSDSWNSSFARDGEKLVLVHDKDDTHER